MKLQKKQYYSRLYLLPDKHGWELQQEELRPQPRRRPRIREQHPGREPGQDRVSPERSQERRGSLSHQHHTGGKSETSL